MPETPEGLLNGCKMPNIDWEVVRAISISEYVSDRIIEISADRLTVARN